ncbi:MAG: M20 family metallopeptidase [Xanthomonadales bacterium]|jgi:glutamate carboxypeptidase|nr:M20 family metallopeptidase [Xanthomonadales bacterium]
MTGGPVRRVNGRPSAPEVLDHLREHRQDLLDILRELTVAESPSDVPDAQVEVRELIARHLESLDYRVRRIPGRTTGGMLFAVPARRKRGQAYQVMLGHYDTVWPLGTLADMPFSVDDNTVRGPGVYDMKAGIVQATLALGLLRDFKVDPALTPVLFFNSDEEIGSGESVRHIRRLARAADRVFVLEPSLGPTGKLKTARKGIGRFTIRVEGEAAHAGLDPGKGASAILELAHVIQFLFALNDLERGITVNVGTVDGGLRPNVVAPASEAVVDVRVVSSEDAEQVEQAINGLQPVTPGTRLRIEGGFGRPAMERTPANRRLWELAVGLGRELGLELEQGMAGGGSDGNFTSLTTATLDGLGAVGDGAHAPHEHLLVEQTLERAALLSLLLMAPPLDRPKAGGGDE